jgi:DNA-binding IclR family transcriptional regulator
MGFWENSLRIVNYLGEVGIQSVRHIAQHTGLSKSSTHRLQEAMKRRNGYAESWLWETAEGRHWLGRLVVATL